MKKLALALSFLAVIPIAGMQRFPLDLENTTYFDPRSLTLDSNLLNTNMEQHNQNNTEKTTNKRKSPESEQQSSETASEQFIFISNETGNPLLLNVHLLDNTTIETSVNNQTPLEIKDKEKIKIRRDLISPVKIQCTQNTAEKNLSIAHVIKPSSVTRYSIAIKNVGNSQLRVLMHTYKVKMVINPDDYNEIKITESSLSYLIPNESSEESPSKKQRTMPENTVFQSETTSTSSETAPLTTTQRSYKTMFTPPKQMLIRCLIDKITASNFTCTLCNQELQKTAIRNHLLNIHVAFFKCNICNQGIKTASKQRCTKKNKCKCDSPQLVHNEWTEDYMREIAREFNIDNETLQKIIDG